MICSTLSGMMAIKHPTLGVLVREDGMVLNKIPGGNHKNYGWKRGCIDSDGYYRIYIRGKTLLVHRLVAECFLPNTENKPTVDHINRVRTDNRMQNLRWATYREQVDNSSWVIDRADYGVRAIENKKQYARNYNKKNRERLLEYNRKYYSEHKDENCEKKKEYHRDYYQAHREELLSKAREYRKAHRDERLEYFRKRNEKNKQEKLAAKESQ